MRSLAIMKWPIAIRTAPTTTVRRWPRIRSASIPPKNGVKYTNPVYSPYTHDCSGCAVQVSWNSRWNIPAIALKPRTCLPTSGLMKR